MLVKFTITLLLAISIDGIQIKETENVHGKDQKISIHDLWSHLRMRPNVCFLKVRVLKLILVPISNFSPSGRREIPW
jgi:hypothetical protein